MHTHPNRWQVCAWLLAIGWLAAPAMAQGPLPASSPRILRDYTAVQLLREPTTPYRKGLDLVCARWQAHEGPHAVENTDEVADRFIRVELKQ